jgi:nicotinic acid mononucleotide adenylyltransferase
MLQAAIRNDKWLRIDTWEAQQTSWTRTKLVLDHHLEKARERFGEDVELRLLAGKFKLFSLFKIFLSLFL